MGGLLRSFVGERSLPSPPRGQTVHTSRNISQNQCVTRRLFGVSDPCCASFETRSSSASQDEVGHCFRIQIFLIPRRPRSGRLEGRTIVPRVSLRGACFE